MSDHTLFTDEDPSDLELDGLEARLKASKAGRPLLDIKSGKQPRPQRVVIYGVEGIGKSTLASAFPRPLYLDTEDGTSHLDVSQRLRWNFEQVREIWKDHSRTIEERVTEASRIIQGE